MNNMLAPGMDRLLDDVDIPVGRKANGEIRIVRDGGGIHLQLFFQNILQAVHDNEEVTIETAHRAIERSHGNLFPRMRFLYQDAQEDGIDACIRVVLSQMVLRGFLIEDHGVWRKGPKFVLDAPMKMVRGVSGEWVTAMVPTEMPTDLPLDGQIDQMRQDIKALAQRLEPTGPGLRPITREGIDDIKRSLLEHGLVPGYPLLYDKKGRWLGGRHRHQAEQELKAEGKWDAGWGETWPIQTLLEIEEDLDAIRVALAGNYARPWTAKDFRRLEKEGLGSTKTETQRRLLELAFIENPGRDTDDAAALIGCSERTARKVRDELRQLGKISATDVKPGAKRDEELWNRVRAAWLASPDATQENIATKTGCGQQHAGTVRKELEAEGLLAPKQGRRGRKPKASVPEKSPSRKSEQTTPGRKKMAAREQKRYGCVYEDELKEKLADMRFTQGLERRQVCQVFGDDRDHLSLVLRLWSDLTHESKPTEPQGHVEQKQQAAQRETQARTPQGEFPYYTVSSAQDDTAAATPAPKTTNGRRWTQQEHGEEDVKPQHYPDRAVILGQAQQLSEDDQLWLRVQLGCHCA